MKIATWNVNSINQRMEHLKDALEAEDIDVMMLQETKCTDQNFPIDQVKDFGYHALFCGQKSYNGVAILSKKPINLVSSSLMNDDQARYIEVNLESSGDQITLVNIYAPHGQSPELPRFKYKMSFYDKLKARLKLLLKSQDMTIVGGDLNVAPEDIDVYDPKKLEGTMGFHIKERQKLRELFNIGFFDAFRLKNPQTQEFTWWDYRSLGFQYNRGMRIDHILTCPQATEKLKNVYTLKRLRSQEKPSDHIPLICKFNI